MQLQSLENILSHILWKKYLLSLRDEIKGHKINDNVQMLSTEKSEDLILMRERIKYLKSDNRFLKDNIFNK